MGIDGDRHRLFADDPVEKVVVVCLHQGFEVIELIGVESLQVALGESAQQQAGFQHAPLVAAE